MKFDESKVINCLHADKAEVGKMYFFAPTLHDLMLTVSADSRYCAGLLEGVCSLEETENDSVYVFRGMYFRYVHYPYIYPYEEESE